jgi:non-specific serine/threonine protein kinase
VVSNPTDSRAQALVLTPQGQLRLLESADGTVLDPQLAAPLRAAFDRGSGHGLLHLGACEVDGHLPPVFGFWRAFAARYATAICGLPDVNDRKQWLPIEAPSAADLDGLARAAPPMTGAEYLDRPALETLWLAIDRAFALEWQASGAHVQTFLASLNPRWNLVGRVHFNLAENRKDDAAPFAFLATYTPSLSAGGKAQHLPLGQALREYAGAKRQAQLLNLLLPVQRAAERCPWLKAMVDAGEIFHPLRWTPADAMRLLRDLPALESAGVVVRVPQSWPGRRPSRPKVTATVGASAPTRIGFDGLLDFRMELSLDGERLSASEIAELLEGTEGLALIRGRWVEIDRERLRRMLEQFRLAEQAAAAEGLDFARAMRLIAGADLAADPLTPAVDPDWAEVRAGPWLAETLAHLRGAGGIARIDPGADLKATLRPYQHAGLRWLYSLVKLGLGGCLADDMGLGKTVQVIALLVVLRRERGGAQRPSVLIAPASLLANWEAEIARFAPQLQVLVAHSAARPVAELQALDAARIGAADLVITSYATVARIPLLTQFEWQLAIIDEAQAIKNPGAQQTRAVKALKAPVHIALTGTPVENRLSDLWSIFDFTNPGLLGNAKTFAAYAKRLAARTGNAYGPLRDLVRPYLLRRLKTDKSVIADLPEKTEVLAYCGLSRKQAALYRQSVDELAERLKAADGIERRGVVLAYLMRFKQICNHPAHWLGSGAWTESDSGKLARLREITEVIAAKQEKVLVFTQFRETIAPLAEFLGGVFGRGGLTLHGQTPIGKRQTLVRQFQEDESIPFFVLSLKAGGSGLNLTAATHVVHFDRWWNPAVENQATDRAYRIGQHRNVLVHKFVCRGTVEERIEEMLAAKRELAGQLIEGGGEVVLTELSDSELLKLVRLDVRASETEV